MLEGGLLSASTQRGEWPKMQQRLTAVSLQTVGALCNCLLEVTLTQPRHHRKPLFPFPSATAARSLLSRVSRMMNRNTFTVKEEWASDLSWYAWGRMNHKETAFELIYTSLYTLQCFQLVLSNCSLYCTDYINKAIWGSNPVVPVWNATLCNVRIVLDS